MSGFSTASANTDDTSAVIRAALALRDAGRADEAVPLLDQALTRHPEVAVLWQTLGLVHRAREDSLAATQALMKAGKLAPSDARIAHALARVTLEAGLPAVDAFEAALSLAPADGDIHMGWTAAKLACGQGASAAQHLARLLDASPGWLEGHRALANLRWLLGDVKEFTSSYVTALRSNRRDERLWGALIDRLIQAGHFAAADAAVREATGACGFTLGLAVSEAICASEVGNDKRADRLFASLQKSNEPALVVRHMRHLLRTGKPQEAARRGEPLLSAPGAAQVWPYIALSWRLLHDARWEWLEKDSRLVTCQDILDPAEAARLSDVLRALHGRSHQPLGQSVRGGTQTDGPLFARIEPEIRGVRSRIKKAVEQHLAALGDPDPNHPVLKWRPGPVRFSGSWSVRLTDAGHHVSHIHPQGWFSSALYVAVPGVEDAGAPPAGWLALGAPPSELGIDLPPFRLVEPKPGRLVLFPSIMWHGTVPFEGGERISIAFDVEPPFPD
jgi:tetratricopeptide (TPR) repeat protein